MSQRDSSYGLKAAEVALKDSNDMRAIFVVTMLFPPGVFMAVSINRSCMLDQRLRTTIDIVQYWFLQCFQHETRVVSSWVWLHRVFTACLTGLALGIWSIETWYGAREREREAAKIRSGVS